MDVLKKIPTLKLFDPIPSFNNNLFLFALKNNCRMKAIKFRKWGGFNPPIQNQMFTFQEKSAARCAASGSPKTDRAFRAANIEDKGV